MTWNINATTKKAEETRLICVSFVDKLKANEVLSGTPTVEELDSSALTIDDAEVTVNTEEWTLAGRTISANQAVQFLVAGGVARTDYTIRVTVGTDAGQVLVEDMRLKVN